MYICQLFSKFDVLLNKVLKFVDPVISRKFSNQFAKNTIKEIGSIRPEKLKKKHVFLRNSFIKDEVLCKLLQAKNHENL